MTLYSVASGPFLLGEVIGAKHPIQERKVDGKIHIYCLVLYAMMPVMESWCDKESLYHRETPVQVGVYER